MSRFLVNHFARAVVKTMRSNQSNKSSQTGSGLDDATIEWSGFSIFLFFIIIVLGIIIPLLILIF